MARIRGKDTRPEVALRKALFALGLRYRIHPSAIPGKPDIVFPRHRAVVFVNGCFWHGHDCHLFKWPKNNAAFWRKKIERNMLRDLQVRQELAAAGWRELTIWECSVRKAPATRFAVVARSVMRWLSAA